MGYQNFNQVMADYSAAGGTIKIPFMKTTGTQTAAIGYTWWQRAGIPNVGLVPTGILVGSQLSGSSPGGLWFNNCDTTGSKCLHLLKFGVGRNSSAVTIPGTYLLADRLAHGQVPANNATGSFAPNIIGSHRLEAGKGGFIVIEVTQALAPAGSTSTFQLEYINENNVAGRTTPIITTVAASVIERFPYANYFFVPLGSYDQGVRAITGYQKVGTNLFSGGSLTIALINPISWIGGDTYCFYNEKENSVQIQNLTKIPNDACLTFYGMPQTVATADLMGEIVLGAE
jgi:hypothetical protein